jgi:hypothetical protein
MARAQASAAEAAGLATLIALCNKIITLNLADIQWTTLIGVAAVMLALALATYALRSDLTRASLPPPAATAYPVISAALRHGHMNRNAPTCRSTNPSQIILPATHRITAIPTHAIHR